MFLQNEVQVWHNNVSVYYQKIALLAPGNACESRVFTYTAKGRVVGAAYTT